EEEEGDNFVISSLLWRCRKEKGRCKKKEPQLFYLSLFHCFFFCKARPQLKRAIRPNWHKPSLPLPKSTRDSTANHHRLLHLCHHQQPPQRQTKQKTVQRARKPKT
ncbi:hypothetical protein VIGAN_02159200, partial [Vigna angularis var. angularis]